VSGTRKYFNRLEVHGFQSVQRNLFGMGGLATASLPSCVFEASRRGVRSLEGSQPCIEEKHMDYSINYCNHSIGSLKNA
jgi:hypothetical protein